MKANLHIFPLFLVFLVSDLRIVMKFKFMDTYSFFLEYYHFSTYIYFLAFCVSFYIWCKIGCQDSFLGM